jgi:hypothetical protein
MLPLALSALVPALAALPAQAVLVAKGDGFLVHAVRPAGGRQTGTAELVLHTALPSGRMTTLTEAASSPPELAPHLPGGGAFFGQRQSVLGVAADAERVYVLRWSLSRTHPRPAVGPHRGGRGEYLLEVFWLADGGPVGRYELAGEGLRKAPPPGSLRTGPLAAWGGGVTAYGEAFRFKGRERAK